MYSATFALEKFRFNEFLKRLDHELKFVESNGDIVSIILYINDLSTNVLAKNVVGFSCLIKTENGLQHKLFKKQGDNFEEIYFLRSNIKGFSTSDFDILLNYSLQDVNITKPACVIFNTSYTRDDDLKVASKALSEILIDNNIDIAMYAEGGCGSSCAKGDGGCAGETCDECATEQVEQVAKVNSIEFDSKLVFPKAKAYDFRDNFLKKNTLGRKYVNYYYKLSYFTNAKNVISKENFMDHVILGIKLYGIAKDLQYGTDNDIIIKDSNLSDIISILNIYRGYTKNESMLKMFSDIEKDMTTFNGKTRKELIELIK